jgi:hypothetical protein
MLGFYPYSYMFKKILPEFIQLLSYYDDEISFTAEELVGLTVDEARQLHFEKDKAWLQS